MAMNTLETRGGTAVHVGQVIEPDKAMEMGRLGQKFSGDSSNSAYGQPSRRVSIRDVAETEEQLEIMMSAGLFLDRLVELGGYKAEVSELDFFIGAAARGGWHIDRIKDWRLLTNLSEFAVHLDIATVWEGRQWVEPGTSDDPPYPLEYETITYTTGEGVLIDNCYDLVNQLPHRGMRAPGKVLLRSFARPIEV